MVTMAFFSFLTVITLALLDRYHLPGTTFTGDAVGSRITRFTSSTTCAMQYMLHSQTRRLPRFLITQNDVCGRVSINRLHAVHTAREVWTYPLTSKIGRAHV